SFEPRHIRVAPDDAYLVIIQHFAHFGSRTEIPVPGKLNRPIARSGQFTDRSSEVAVGERADRVELASDTGLGHTRSFGGDENCSWGKKNRRRHEPAGQRGVVLMSTILLPWVAWNAERSTPPFYAPDCAVH